MKAVWDWEAGWIVKNSNCPYHVRWLTRGIMAAASITEVDGVYCLEIYTSVPNTGAYNCKLNTLEAAKSFADEAISLLGYRTLQNHLKALL